MEIDNSQFYSWKKDPTTIKLLEALKVMRDSIEKNMTNEEVIFAPNSKQVLARLVGVREGLDLVLNIDVDDLVEGEQEDDQANPI